MPSRSNDPNRPHGLDPERVLAMGQTPQSDVDNSGYGGFVPPTVEAISEAFPDLQVLSFLGRGGMGAVYKAVQRKLGRPVALKVLPPEASKDAAFAERFTREARALAKLNHPNIVGIYDFGESGGFFFLLMELIDGMNLREMLEMGQLSAREALDIVPQVCDALQFAHDQGIVHRDIKPENLLIDERGRVHIADFGLAKLLGHTAEPVPLTKSRQVVGTPHYMAPEQIEQPAHVDHRADIFSLGVVFYEMLTGQLPLGRFEPPSARADVADQLDAVVMRTLEREPARRYQAAREMKSDVESLATGDARRGGTHVESSTGELSTQPPRLSTLTLCGFLWLMIGGVAAIGTMVFATMPLPPADPPGSESPSTFAAHWDAWLPFMLVGMICSTGLLGGPILGAISIPRIRNSAGRLYGMGMAVFTTFILPLLIANFLVTWSTNRILSQDVRGVMVPVLAIVLIGLDIWFLVWMTKQLSVSQAQVEPA